MGEEQPSMASLAEGAAQKAPGAWWPRGHERARYLGVGDLREVSRRSQVNRSAAWPSF